MSEILDHNPAIDQQPRAIDPNAPSWSSITAIGLWITSVALMVIVPLFFLLPYVAVVGGGNLDGAAVTELVTKNPTAVLLQVLAILPVHLLTLLVGWFIVTRYRRNPFLESLGWRSGGMRWWHYVVIMVAFLSLMVLVGSLVPAQENDLLRILKSSNAALYTVAFLSVATAPVVEELVYRGVVYSAFHRTFGMFPAIIFVTFLFAIVHVPQYLPSYSTIFLLTLLSLILTVIRAVTGNLLPCIILHTIFNGVQSVVLIAESQAAAN